MNIGELLGGGFRILAKRPKELIIWSVIQLVIGALLVMALIPFMTAMTQFQQQALGATGPVPPVLPGGMGLFFLAYLLLLVWLLMMFTAVVRAASNDGGDTFGWLRFGMDELRLIGLGLLYIVAAIILEIVAVLIGGMIVGLAAVASPALSTVLTVILVILCFCAAVWVWVRLSLMGAVFVLEKNFALRRGWQATKGHFWALFLTYLVMAIAYFIVEMVIIAIMSPALLGTMFAGATDPQQAIERQQQMMSMFSSPSVGLIIIWVIGSVIGTAAMVYFYGVVATAAIAATGHSRADLAGLESAFE